MRRGGESMGRHDMLLAVCAAVAIALGAAGGCGRPPAAALEGSVTFAGQPIDDGTIRLFPVDGTPGPGAAALVAAGRFAIEPGKGLVPGRYMVAIAATRPTGRTVKPEPGSEADGSVAEYEQFVPDRYNTKSELQVTLEAGRNEHVFTLLPAP